MFILGLQTNGIIQTGWGRGVFIGVLVIIGIVLVFFLEKHVIIISTSFAGAYGYLYYTNI